MISKVELSKLSHAEKDELILNLLSTIETLTLRIEKLEATTKELQTQNKELQLENKELRERLNKNSSNSSKPPSSDGFKKQERTTPKKSTRTSGGQKGHRGYTREMSDSPDTIIAHYLNQCPCCQSKQLHVNEEHFKTRQIHEITPPPLTVTEHRCFEHICLGCGKTVSPLFPKEVSANVTFGPNIKALIVYLKNYQLLPYNRIQELLFDQYGVGISEGTIATIEQKAAKLMHDTYEEIKTHLESSALLHADETGVRINSSLHWNHVYSNQNATYFAAHEKRGKDALYEIDMLINYQGILSHDFWSSYYSLDQVTHSACNAHLLRELKAESQRSSSNLADNMSQLLVQIKDRVEESAQCKISSREYKSYRKRYRSIVTQAINSLPPPQKVPGKRGRPKKGKSLCLWERLRDYEDAVLLFAKESLAPFDNNQAERDLRMYKVKMKISGCFRNKKSADDFSIIRSVISTIKKQGRSVMQDINMFFQGQTPVILPE